MRCIVVVFAAALAGCAQWIHVPPHTGSAEGWARWSEPPAQVELSWHRVGLFELQARCKNSYSPLLMGGGVGSSGPAPSVFGTFQPRASNGCAYLSPDRKRCTIYTQEYVTEALVGHEVLHCFIGKNGE